MLYFYAVRVFDSVLDSTLSDRYREVRRGYGIYGTVLHLQMTSYIWVDYNCPEYRHQKQDILD